ncbi:MAG TPA: His/Gly/Thr/Pro-type tRNA ligase C-terminal domain-containing protein, partial [Elusimicrobiota bacterium]|nr:His/Gly/Thr/Pro-type tRNA ligase C-terminal domain-containing protein [Elusimicrobiota bacterium]
AGLERLVLALPDALPIAPARRAFVVAIGDDGRAEALKLLRELRRAGVSAQMEFEAKGVRAQMKRADRLKAAVTLIVGGDELARGEVTLRDMASGDQRAVPRPAIVETVKTRLGAS